MYYVAQTDNLVADGILGSDQAREIERRARAAMVALAVNALLIGGIIAAAFGMVMWLNDALSVAVVGCLSAVAGVVILRWGAALYRMFGNAAAMIGAGMLASGAGMELVKSYPDSATAMMLGLGAVIAGAGLFGVWRGGVTLRFASGAILLMGLGLHFAGLVYGVQEGDLASLPVPLLHLYSAGVLIAAGCILDLRIVTALAIVPLAQMFETGTFYSHAMYAFYSPEPSLSILQMGAVIGACVWGATKAGPMVQRQAGVLAVMAFIVMNLCFLVGSLLGDVVGQHVWGPTVYDHNGAQDYDTYRAALDRFYMTAWSISETAFAIIWALLLVAVVIWAARGNRRGLFNAGMTFGAIHAYTQMFENFGDQPLALVVGGVAAVPLAWGLWRVNATLWGGDDPAPQEV